MMSPIDVPMQIQRTALTHQLGTPINVYKTTIFGTIVGTIIVLGLSLFAFLGIITVKNDVASSQVIPVIIVPLLLMLFAVYLIVKVVRVAGQRVYLFQQGMIIKNKGQIQVFPWNQVVEVRETIDTHKRSYVINYRVRRVDGYQTTLDENMRGIAELGPAIIQGVTPELLPRALNALQGGQALTFGPFSVHQQGIVDGHRFLPWAEVEEVNVTYTGDGTIRVQKVGQGMSWSVCRTSRMPNHFVFAALVNFRSQRVGRR